jgi:hypothetical protein
MVLYPVGTSRNFKKIASLPVVFKPLRYCHNHKLVKGKFEKSLDQLDNDIDKWIAAPSVLLTMNR